MSRSTSIWVVFDGFGQLTACFTVMHEVATWIEAQDESREGWTIIRYPDNPSRYNAAPPRIWDVKEFLDAH